jgi:OOP family OmpA-OmpF porin
MAPELCQAQLIGVQLDAGKITFEPGSATVEAASGVILDKIAAILEDCGPIRLEIQGHTDSQGREEMNQNLSQARAQSVLNELRARRILTSTYVARGYGESTPIASNDTEEGREANRRIEFKLMLPGTGIGADGKLDADPAETASEESATELAPVPEAPEEPAQTDDSAQETSDQ